MGGAVPVLLAAEAVNPLTPSWLEIGVGLVCFLLLFVVLRQFVLPRFERVYAERDQRINGGQQRAEELREQAAGLQREYEEQLALLRAEAAGIRDDARAEGARIRAELRADAEAQVARVREQGEAQIEAAREQVMREMRGELGGLSTGLAERIVGAPVAPASSRAVDRFLEELEGRADAPS
ncbi:ATP synthase F0 subunit B [Pseudonocardia sp. CNS-139]|nr:ATP synthase F0 subunit B [Pseudonocardia sp. CNS-139]